MACPATSCWPTARTASKPRCAAEPFDLIISDYNLPGYDGVAALKQAQAAQPDVPVILISGTVVEEQAVKCLHIGATDYLLKGRLERLVPAVRRAIQEAETRRAHKRGEAALGESESRKAAILDSVLDCIVTMDARGIVIEFNDAAARTFGYTKAEAIGRSLADLIIPQRFRERHRAGLARYLATGEGDADREADRDHGGAIGWLRNSGRADDHGDSLRRGPDLHRRVARHHGAQAGRCDPRASRRHRRLVRRRHLQHGAR